MFIIHKNGNETCIQPSLESHSTIFMFNNIYCEMNIKKAIHWRGLGNWGNLPNFLFEMEFQVYTNIQAISTLVLLIFDDNGLVMYNYSFFIIVIIIYLDFLLTPRRGSHVKSDKTHTESSRYTP